MCWLTLSLITALLVPPAGAAEAALYSLKLKVPEELRREVWYPSMDIGEVDGLDVSRKCEQAEIERGDCELAREHLPPLVSQPIMDHTVEALEGWLGEQVAVVGLGTLRSAFSAGARVQELPAARLAEAPELTGAGHLIAVECALVFGGGGSSAFFGRERSHLKVGLEVKGTIHTPEGEQLWEESVELQDLTAVLKDAEAVKGYTRVPRKALTPKEVKAVYRAGLEALLAGPPPS
jgi:hypothetical protein